MRNRFSIIIPTQYCSRICYYNMVWDYGTAWAHASSEARKDALVARRGPHGPDEDEGEDDEPAERPQQGAEARGERQAPWGPAHPSLHQTLNVVLVRPAWTQNWAHNKHTCIFSLN